MSREYPCSEFGKKKSKVKPAGWCSCIAPALGGVSVDSAHESEMSSGLGVNKRRDGPVMDKLHAITGAENA